jgi:hypothetical protein
MSLDPVEQLRRYHAALNRYEEAVVTPMFAPEAVYVSPGVNGRLVGREAIIAAFNAYFAEHPDQIAIDDSIAAVDPRTVQASWRLEATARSSGAQVRRRGTETVTFDAAGLIIRVEVQDA